MITLAATDNQINEIDAWLKDKGVTLWADWYIEDPVQRRVAATWFANQINEMSAHRKRAAHTRTVTINGSAVGGNRETSIWHAGAYDVV